MKRALAISLLVCLGAMSARAASLFEQSVSVALAQRFNSRSISYLLIDARSKQVIASRWPNAGRAVPPGSLVKPILALAFAESHGDHFPEFTCHGTIDGCWYPPGHGRLGITQAVEFSCNAYFRKLAQRVSPADLRAALERLGITSAPAGLTPDELIGLGGTWRIPPRELARAYLNLVAQADEPEVAPIVRGMALSAQAGTAKAIGRALGGRAALAKTGTAPCIHARRAPGDGYVIALYPVEAPRLLLLVSVHGVPGAEAAVTAGKILSVAVDGP